MKIYEKNGLSYKNGYIVTQEGDIVCIDNEVVDMANHLEEMYQKAMWLNDQPKFCAGPNTLDFKRESEDEIDPYVVETPLYDTKVKESMLLMEEIELTSIVERMNNAARNMAPLFYFVKNDSVISCEHGTLHKFDLPSLGNPLEWTEDFLDDVLKSIYDVEDKLEDAIDEDVIEDVESK